MQSSTEPLRPVAELIAEIEETTGERCEVPYRKILQCAVERRIPLTRLENGRWAFRRSDIPAIVAGLPRLVVAR